MSEITIQQGDNIELLKAYPNNHFDSVVTDCPYGLGKEPDALKLLQDWIDHGYHEIKGKGFMGNTWDAFVPQPFFWKEIFRVLKPGGYILAFFGTRTYDWGTMAIRLAGFEIRDMITWHYASGFPKSLDISKAIDKKLGQVRNKETKSVGDINNSRLAYKGASPRVAKNVDSKDAISDEAKQWQGYGTALKPATEPICVARKPIEGTVAENILKYGTGGINLDGCRIDANWDTDKNFRVNGRTGNVPDTFFTGKDSNQTYHHNTDGRFPTNVIFDPLMGDLLGEQTGVLSSGGGRKGEDGKRNYLDNTNSVALSGARSSTGKIYVDPIRGEYTLGKVHNDIGGASRYFYCAKASQDERNAGCEHLIKQQSGVANDKGRSFNGVCLNTNLRLQVCNCGNCKHDIDAQIQRENFHPTVKPISLIRYLQRLVTPKGGKILDPYAGSGTSGCAAAFEEISIVLMEMMPEYIPIIEARTAYWQKMANREKYIQQLKDSQTTLF